MTNRRDFLKTSAVLGGALGVGLLSPSPLSALAQRDVDWNAIPKAPKPLRILILGGTGFIGPNQVRYAVARGHHVTLFNRGKTNPGLFKGVPNIVERLGDRAPKPGNYDSLKDGEWDVVIDNPTTIPRWVREAAEAVKGRAKQYVFISTISVYAANDTPGADETAAVGTTDTPDAEGTTPNAAGVVNPNAVSGNLYGPLKALSEKEAEKAFPGHATIIRPGLIVGVGDQSDRYSYWPVRIEKGGEVLCPPGDDPIQFIDARDLGEWSIRCCENDVFGVFNATGPAKKFTFRQMVEGARDTLKSDAKFTYVTPEFIRAQGLRSWTGQNSIAAWVPSTGATAGFAQRNIAKAISKGLTFRPYPETVKETLAFYKTLTPDRQEALRSGLTLEKEKAVLAAWHAEHGGL